VSVVQCFPICNIESTFTDIFYFEPKTSNKGKLHPYYQNPICLSKEYKRMIDTGEVKHRSELKKNIQYLSNTCLPNICNIKTR
jgi:hypothetical protein